MIFLERTITMDTFVVKSTPNGQEIMVHIGKTHEYCISFIQINKNSDSNFSFTRRIKKI